MARGRKRGESPHRAAAMRWAAELYQDGHSTRDVADVMRCSHEHVRKLLLDGGVELRWRGHPMAPPWGADELAEAIRLYVDEHWTTPQIAERFGVTAPCIKHRLNAAGIQLRPPGTRWYDPEDDEKIAALYRGGLSMAAVARRLGVSDHRVVCGLKRLGVPSRPVWNGLVRYHQKHTPEDIDEMVRLYTDGCRTLTEIADCFGCHHNTVRYWLLKRGVELRPGKPRPAVMRRRDGATGR